MTAANFDPSLAIILREEGGNDDDPHDHGGRTSRGITQVEYDIYRRRHADLPADVWQAPAEAVHDIYRTQYWNPYCDSLPAGIDLLFFNASVNSGRQQAVRELQRALNVKADGMMGMETMGAVNMPQDYQALVHSMSEQRRAFYKRLAQFPRYGKGWLARTDRVEADARKMAPVFTADAGIPNATDGMTETLSAKAMPESIAEPTVSVSQATGGTAGASLGTGIVSQLQEAAGHLSPFQDSLTIAKYICMGIAVICAAFAIYAVIHKKHNDAVT